MVNEKKFTVAANMANIVFGLLTITNTVLMTILYIKNSEVYFPEYRTSSAGCFQLKARNNTWGEEICLWNWINISVVKDGNRVRVYSPADKVWIESDNMLGPAGPYGPQGVKGETGLPGRDGIDGLPGNCAHLTCQTIGKTDDCCGSGCLNCNIGQICVQGRCATPYSYSHSYNGLAYHMSVGDYSWLQCKQYCSSLLFGSGVPRPVIVREYNDIVYLGSWISGYTMWTDCQYNGTGYYCNGQVMPYVNWGSFEPALPKDTVTFNLRAGYGGCQDNCWRVSFESETRNCLCMSTA
jgi:hypothetical protein